MTAFPEDSFRELEETIVSCARMAREAQRGIRRMYKSDGSVLTETDMKISGIVEDRIRQLFPECGYICEETPVRRIEGSQWTFILDPVDGTDVYSQGLPCWAVSLGILDSERRPVGAVIAAPRFGIGQEELLVSLCPGKRLRVDGADFVPADGKDEVEQVTVGSTDQATLDFSRFHGKVRTFGSSILHLISPVVFPSIQGCINQPAYVWDMASSHAVLLAAGMELVYADRSRFEYTDEILYGKKKYRMEVYAGSRRAVESLMESLPVRAL